MMATRILKDIQRQVAEGEAKGEARGKAEGKAEGMIDAIRQLVRSGALSIDAARTQIRALAKTKKLSTSLAKAALTQLG